MAIPGRQPSRPHGRKGRGSQEPHDHRRGSPNSFRRLGCWKPALLGWLIFKQRCSVCIQHLCLGPLATPGASFLAALINWLLSQPLSVRARQNLTLEVISSERDKTRSAEVRGRLCAPSLGTNDYAVDQTFSHNSPSEFWKRSKTYAPKKIDARELALLAGVLCLPIRKSKGFC